LLFAAVCSSGPIKSTKQSTLRQGDGTEANVW
jgi:hypothetical protein